jgi:hypothetical protein
VRRSATFWRWYLNNPGEISHSYTGTMPVDHSKYRADSVPCFVSGVGTATGGSWRTSHALRPQLRIPARCRGDLCQEEHSGRCVQDSMRSKSAKTLMRLRACSSLPHYIPHPLFVDTSSESFFARESLPNMLLSIRAMQLFRALDFCTRRSVSNLFLQLSLPCYLDPRSMRGYESAADPVRQGLPAADGLGIETWRNPKYDLPLRTCRRRTTRDPQSNQGHSPR